MRSVRLMARLFLAAAVIACSLPAVAQDQAARLLQAIETVVYLYGNPTAPVRLTTGKVDVRTEGATAIATVPDVAFVGTSGRDRLEIGTVTVTRRELAPGRSLYETQFPPAMRAVEGSREIARITLGAHKLSIVADDAAGWFDELDLSLAQLSITDARDGGQFGIAQVAATGRMERRADGRIDYPAAVSFSDLSFREPRSGQDNVRIGRIAFAATVRGLPPDVLEQARALAERSHGAPYSQQMQMFIDVLLDSGISLYGGSAELADVVIAQSGQEMRLGRFVSSGEWQAQSDRSSQYTALIALEGLVLPPIVPYQQLIAGRTELRVMIDRIPSGALAAFLRNGIEFGPTPDDPPRARPGAAETLADAVMQSGLTLRIAPFLWDAAALGAHLDGEVSAAPGGAVIPMAASGALALRGLETLAQELGLGPGQEAAAITMLQALGQQGAGPDGQPARLYRFEVTGDGRATLNGTDMSALMGLMRPQRRQP